MRDRLQRAYHIVMVTISHLGQLSLLPSVGRLMSASRLIPRVHVTRAMP